jgi:hypothetical protein
MNFEKAVCWTRNSSKGPPYYRRKFPLEVRLTALYQSASSNTDYDKCLAG